MFLLSQSPGFGKLRAVVITHVHIHRPPFVAAPCVGHAPGHTRSYCRRDQLKRCLDRAALLSDLAGASDRITQRIVNEDKPRDSCGFDNVLGATDNHGRDTSFFEMTCDQTHGLMTDRSKRHQHHDIDVVFFGPGHDLCCIGVGSTLRVLGGHAVEAIADTADHAVVGE